MKKQIALTLAGTAAAVAGGLRLVQELVERGDRHQPETGIHPEGQEHPTAPASTSPGTPPEGAETGKAATEPSGPGSIRATGSASKAELYELATELGINGRSKMSKAELIEAINQAG